MRRLLLFYGLWRYASHGLNCICQRVERFSKVVAALFHRIENDAGLLDLLIGEREHRDIMLLRLSYERIEICNIDEVVW